MTGLLVLLVALTAAVDLRRLQTPRGAALAWTESAVFGGCRPYLSLSTAQGETRSDDEVCAALTARTAPARKHTEGYDLHAVSVAQTGAHATVVIEVRTPQSTSRVTEELVRQDHTWRVVRPPSACAPSCY